LLVSGAAAVRCGISIDSNSLNILQEGAVKEFVGNVNISGDGFRVTSEKAVADDRTGVVRAVENVHVNYSSGTWNVRGKCSELEIKRTQKTVFMYGDTVTKYVSTENSRDSAPAVIYADRARIDYGESQKAVFNGNVKVSRDTVNIYSDAAEYAGDKGEIIFTGSPRAISIVDETVTEYYGEEIRVYTENERIEITGNARTKVSVNESKM